MSILLTNDVNIKNINIRNKLKYSNNFDFVPITYNKTDFIIQTPKLYSKYGINNFFKNNNYIDLSFKNIDNDDEVFLFLKLLNNINNHIKSKYQIKDYIKNYDNEKIIRFKINKYTTFYDNRKNKITNISRNTYGNYIICLSGLWINKDSISCEWRLLQAKIYLPVHLTDYSFIDKKIPPPPPLPKFGLKKENKIIIEKKNKTQTQKNKEIIVPHSLEEITKVLLNLKKKKSIL